MLPRKTIETFVRMNESHDEEQFMHESCYQLAKMMPSSTRNVKGIKLGRSPWGELMVNNYLKNHVCQKCKKKLQCTCSPFQVSDPDKKRCEHADK